MKIKVIIVALACLSLQTFAQTLSVPPSKLNKVLNPNNGAPISPVPIDNAVPMRAVGNKNLVKTFPNDNLKTIVTTLPNGLKIFISVNKDKPRVQTLIAVKTGSKNDPADHTGLSHYLEHMLFKGTDAYGSLDFSKEAPLLAQIEALYEKYGSTTDDNLRKQIYAQIDSVSGLAAKYAIANEYDKMMSQLAAQGTNAFTSNDMTVYVNDVPSNQINRWIMIEAERFRNPQMRLFHTELEAVYEEKNRGLDNDGRKSMEAMMAGLFKNHTYGTQTTIGTIEHLKSPSITAIKNYYNERYVPNNMAIIVCGDVDPDNVIAEISKSFAYMKPKALKPYVYLSEPTNAAPVEQTVYGPDAENITIAYRLNGIKSGNEYYMQQLLESLLDNSANAGLININLMQSQKVLKASADLWANTDYSIFMLDAKSRKEQTLEDCKALLLHEIENLKAGNFDEQLVKSTIANMKVNETKTLESNAGRAYSLENIFIHEIDYTAYLDRFNYLEKLTKSDIIDYVNKNFNTNCVIVYKRQGVDKDVKKVVKPTITPVTVNRDAKSEFVKRIEMLTPSAITPVFTDYTKEITFEKLNNNIPLWYIQNKENDLFSMYYLYEMGSLNDKKLSLAIEYLKYIGTANKQPDEFSKALYSLACKFNVNVGREQTYVILTGPQQNFEAAVQLFEALLNNCVINADKLPKLVESIIKDRADAKKNKAAIRAKLVDYAVYGSNSPSTYILSNEALQQVSAQELIDKIKTLSKFDHKIMYYGPANADAVKSTLNKLHITSQTKLPIPEKVQLNRVSVTESNVFFVNYPMVQAEISWNRKSDLYNENILASSEIFNEYFGGGMSSIVFQTIRESKALAYSTYASFSEPNKKEDPFYMNAYVGTQADKLNEAVAGMNDLLNNLPMSEASFATAKAALTNNIENERILKTEIFFSYLDALKHGINYNTNKNLYALLPKYTLNDVQQFHEKYVKNKAYNYCLVANAEKINKDELSKLGKFKELTLAEIFGY